MISKRIHKGPFLNIYSRRIRLPNKHVMNFEFVKHRGAVMVIPFDGKNKLILIRQYRPAIGKTIYEFPAGIIEKNETFLRCAKRELAEETGYTADMMRKTGFIYTVPGYSNEKIFVYTASGLTKGAVNRDKAEIIENCTLSIKEFKNMVRSGKITDGKTLAGAALTGIL